MAIADWTISTGGNHPAYSVYSVGTWSQEGNPGGCFKGLYITELNTSGNTISSILRTVNIPTGYSKILAYFDTYINETDLLSTARMIVAGTTVYTGAPPNANIWITTPAVDITSAIAGATSISLEIAVVFTDNGITKPPVGSYILIDNIKLIGVI